ncbi:MAG: precorrin-6y C5,15-methyltransferase (decarboxylating) subunit CbiE [Natronospirillum sp.]|uniref:precorrin-6y C5,15-methyltransferase (decarboxylating) subunit CbiE n=1 Tax=Natronospirillum sp. TaxID=2812955 RepID=UPI0025DF62AF|nr:precorrin-6y C5,15-methyltransferase (decarboxylating) subunit CbiE [Natronospirillum sp.]MCH8553140.1 precorrin-6y C5,15-methyltransferase (decarboxylating) subunit CbiE [Natronospirillum sp.]
MDKETLSPWLTIVGWGENGTAGLTPASRTALEQAEFIFGAERHLAVLPEGLSATVKTWPVPFADGLPELLARRGRKVVMLASQDPFWFGAGTVLTEHLDFSEWTALPAPSTFSLAAARLGWALEQTVCLGLHAAPLTRLRPHLAPGQRLLVLLRNGDAVADLATWLDKTGFGHSRMTVLEALGGEREQVRSCRAGDYALQDVHHPVAVGLEVSGDGPVLSCGSGLDDDLFEHDGQFTKRPIRALTLSALAPRPGELLWDIGAGSGAIAIEWLLAHPANRAIAFEENAERAVRARSNADNLGADRLTLVEGPAPDILEGQPHPDAVFIGGGLSEELLSALTRLLPAGTRLVANAVTLESEALLTRWQSVCGGELLRVEMATASPLGKRRGWRARYPIVQWQTVL